MQVMAAGHLITIKDSWTIKMNRILPGLIWMILWILSWLPGFILRFLSYLLNAIVFVFFRYRHEVVRANLDRSFPELSLLERQRIGEKFYQHFSELFLEMILLIRLRPKKSSRRLRLINPEILADALQKKQNIILIGGHYGNWEWNVPLLLASGYRVLAVYKPQSSRFADQLMKNIRQRPGVVLVPMKDTLRMVSNEQKGNNSPFALLLIADQIPAWGDIRFWTPFLNQNTAFFTGAEKLAIRFNLPVYYVDQIKNGFGSYEARMTLAYDGISPTGKGDITRTFVSLLEKSIRQLPHLWLWSHRRWKYRNEELPLSA